jgi:hypothetical protein
MVLKHVFLCALILVSSGWSLNARPQAHPDARRDSSTSIDQVIDRFISSEKSLTDKLRSSQPLVETYVQGYSPDKEWGDVPKGDDYFLGKLDSARAISLMPGPGIFGKIMGVIKQPFSMKYVLDGFAAMAVVDRVAFNRERYDFKYVRREFLGEVRCLVFDVVPSESARDRFSGRIWVEDRDFNIVRFNGVNGTIPGFFGGDYFFHFDSWRLNAGPGLWLPAQIYCEESNLEYGLGKVRKLRFRGQTRIWGYDLNRAGRQDELTTVVVDEPAVRDRSEIEHQMSPVWSRRQWQRQAEDNVIERLEAGGLIAPKGEVDKILETVVNNIVITNELNIDPEVRCRVLLTTPLESFTVGHTIVLSRGFIDVLPDEASLATMLAHELGHIILGHKLVDTKFSFHDRMAVDDKAVLDNFRFQRQAAEETAADGKAVELLKKSPYGDKMTNAGLFLRAVASRAKQLPSLIRPHLGDRIANGGDILRLAQLMNSAPQLERERTDQIAALPLGGRIFVNPWSSELVMVKNKPVALISAREKTPFEVTPLIPYLSYKQPANVTFVSKSNEPNPD